MKKNIVTFLLIAALVTLVCSVLFGQTPTGVQRAYFRNSSGKTIERMTVLLYQAGKVNPDTIVSYRVVADTLTAVK